MKPIPSFPTINSLPLLQPTPPSTHTNIDKPKKNQPNSPLILMGINKRMVLSLYRSLFLGNKRKATALLAPQVDWWFHGPPGRDHMMQVLTGVEVDKFRFMPRRVTEVGTWVVVEGWGLNRHDDSYWVHVWVVDGEVITKFREYFNTCVTIRELGPVLGKLADWAVWKSRERAGRQLPGLVLVV